MNRLTRRRFLQVGGATAAGVAAAPYVRVGPAGAAGATPPERVALIVLDDARYDDIAFLPAVAALMQ